MRTLHSSVAHRVVDWNERDSGAAGIGVTSIWPCSRHQQIDAMIWASMRLSERDETVWTLAVCGVMLHPRSGTNRRLVQP